MILRKGMAALRLVAMLAGTLVLTGCAGGLLPGEGPTAAEILGETPDSAKQQREYAIVPISGDVVSAQMKFEQEGLFKTFSTGTPWTFRNAIGAGDVLQVHIWEAAEGGLFSTADSKGVQLPPVEVDRAGRISLPFVGRIRAAGLTPAQLQRKIEHVLAGKAISPQVMVRVLKSETNSIVINGDVRKPGKYQMSLKGDRILDMIAQAGGAAGPARETLVTLIRNGVRGTQNLKRIIRNPSENIYVRPGDQIYLSHKPQTFTAFGAVSKTGEYPFDSDRVNILEAVARAGGLLDTRADSKGVFLFRFEDNKVLRAFGHPQEEMSPTGITPVVYVLDMSKPRAFFLAQGFLMKDNDVIYVANSVSTELQKFLALINAGTGAIRGTHATAVTVSGD